MSETCMYLQNWVTVTSQIYVNEVFTQFLFEIFIRAVDNFMYIGNEFHTSDPCILTHWGRVTHICVGKIAVIDSDNGLSPGRCQGIIWTNAGILLIGPLETNFNEILIEFYELSFKKIHFKMSSGKWRPSCLGLNVSILNLCNIYLASL